MCHHCGCSQPLPRACPSCGGLLNFIGVGTQRVQEELEELFPGVEVLRMDTDYSFRRPPPRGAAGPLPQAERMPILVGTQMVAKGLDFENVTLVGVVASRPVPVCGRLPGGGADLLPAHPGGGPGRTGREAGPGGDPDLHPG
ncbi:MAG: hypothetical protein V8S34_08025 [Lawsonibacter sp.]